MDRLKSTHSAKLEKPERYSEELPLTGDMRLRLTESGHDEVDLHFVTPNTEVRLADLVPGVIFKFGNKLEVNMQTREVFLRHDLLQNPRNVFGVLHELGHLRVADQQFAAPSRHGEIRAITVAKSKDVSQLTEEDARVILADERAAWAQGLRLAREIKSTHPELNLFKVFSDSNDLAGWIRLSGLTSYECDVADAGKFDFSQVLSRSESLRAWFIRSLDDLFPEEIDDTTAFYARTNRKE